MGQIQELKELITPLVAEDGIRLYDVAWHTEGSMRVLQVSIMHKDGSMDIDTCTTQSEEISAMLDELDMITSEHFLGVCSPGTERELKNEEQIKDAIGEFVYVELKDPKAGMDDVKGTPTTFENNTVYLDYMARVVKKKARIKMDNIALIRLSVKIQEGCEQKIELKDFMAAMQAIETDRKLSKEVVVGTLQKALTKAFRKYIEISDMLVRVDVNEKSGNIKVYQQRLIVENVEDDELEISLEDAKRINQELGLGGVVGEEVSIADLGRAAIILAKDIMKQKIREAEKLVVYEEYRDKVEEMVMGTIESVEEKLCVINISKTLTLIPKNQQTPNERYRKGEMIRVVITEVNRETKSAQVLVSRGDVTLVKRLFEKEIPEIFQGIIEIKAIVREAGERTKMAVYSHNENIGPISACIGPRGQRVQVIIDELGGEKIDIFEWSEDVTELIKNALSPAEVLAVIPSEECKGGLLVVVPDNQLSLTIGKRGKNARLTVKLTGNKIDIKAETDVDTAGINWKKIAMKQYEELLARQQEAKLAAQMERFEENAQPQDVLSLDGAGVSFQGAVTEEVVSESVMEESSEPVEAIVLPAVEEANVSTPVEEVVEEAQLQGETDLERATRIARERQKQEGLDLEEKQEHRSKFETLADASAKQDDKAVAKPCYKKYDKYEEKEERRKPTFDLNKKDYEMKPIYSEEELAEIEREECEIEESGWIHDEIGFDEYDKYHEEQDARRQMRHEENIDA